MSSERLLSSVRTRDLGRVAYAQTFAQMQAFTAARGPDTPDELWLCEHDPVFTQGLAGQAGHLLSPGDIPVVQSNRGGQVTYHGPGQIVAYPLLDLRRHGYFIKEYVRRLEQAVIDTLADHGVDGQRVNGAPGIYVALPGDGRAAGLGAFAGLGKIAALGIKVSQHCTYHGVALNVDMDLEPYSRINPCGYAGLRTVDLSTMGVQAERQDVAQTLARHLVRQLAAPAVSPHDHTTTSAARPPQDAGTALRSTKAIQ
ncbi:MAG: Octanoyltransferase [Paracidovorax wautersii]|uniref:Octanoyltransferase n=1 Tax=Paracidovorax wautersii TaxID=1177982 RepID=A0A7V8JNY3_9BURK|nr:MAG: Octanoyltransferase [Paracidovorax wautersii]